jgi:MATE family multidrug resistance protein
MRCCTAALQVALPSSAMICLDWWTFELLTLLAGWLPDAQTAVGAMGVCFGLHVMVFLLVSGERGWWGCGAGAR